MTPTLKPSDAELQAEICDALLTAFPMADKVADNYAAVAVRTLIERRASGQGEPVADDDSAAKWRENVEAMLSDGDSDVIRCHEGGGPESLIGSLVLTMMRTRRARDKALASPQPNEPAGVSEADIEKAASTLAAVTIAELERDRDHWKANHAEMVQRNAVLRERPDLPVDRLPAIARYEARIAALEASQQAEAVPAFKGVAKRKLDDLQQRGWQVVGYALQNGEQNYGFITAGAFVGWWLPESYPLHTSDVPAPSEPGETKP